MFPSRSITLTTSASEQSISGRIAERLERAILNAPDGDHARDVCLGHLDGDGCHLVRSVASSHPLPLLPLPVDPQIHECQDRARLVARCALFDQFSGDDHLRSFVEVQRDAAPLIRTAPGPYFGLLGLVRVAYARPSCRASASSSARWTRYIGWASSSAPGPYNGPAPDWRS